ncbi:IS982 family transposase [Paracnuella aquatica]|uniref:IS982 family transposase n=1 Tax=Paracnuella aquatica TaxID=2268757 RepID=UPI000DEEEFAE|nr:IS982 family transposase [Paracnuella aquatica]RPD51457.1 IS982 family transposase [Paracnuella aquatica]
MLSDDKIIALYCIVDDTLKAMRHYEDKKVRVSDSEVITTAFVSVLYFGGHLDNGRHFMKLKGYVPGMLGKSRFCRRLHRLSDFMLALFFYLGKRLKDMAGAATYRLDSFPVAVCDNIRISRSKVLEGEVFRGKHAAMRRYFYGVQVQVLILDGLPVEFCLVPGAEADVRALGKLPLDVAPESCIYMDAGYTDYGAEDDLFDAELIHAMVQRKKNSKRKDAPSINFLKEHMRKQIETDFSCIKAKMLRSIHAVTQNCFLLKVALFVIAFTFDQIA